MNSVFQPVVFCLLERAVPRNCRNLSANPLGFSALSATHQENLLRWQEV